MNNHLINTPLNVNIENTIASVGDRMVAAIIDIAIIWVYLFFIMVVMGILKISNPAAFLIPMAPIIFYSLLFEMFNEGQSPGKHIMKLQVLSQEGDKPGFFSLFLRWIFRLIDIYLFSGIVAFFFILFSKKSQRIGDMAGGTIVIKKDKRDQLSNTIFEEVSSGHIPKYSMVTMLSDEEIYTIKEVLVLVDKNSFNDTTVRLLKKTRDRVAEKLSISPQEPPLQFLQNLLKDYNYFYSSHYQKIS